MVSTPRLVPGPGEEAEEEKKEQVGAVKEAAPQSEGAPNGDKADSKQKRPGDPAGGVKKKTKKK